MNGQTENSRLHNKGDRMSHSEQPKEHYDKGGITVCIGEGCEICKGKIKKPRLLYWEDGEDAWCPVPNQVDGELICTSDQLGEGEETEIRFMRIDMTDEEFEMIPES